MANAYELGTAQTFDRATPKIEDITGNLPQALRENQIRGLFPLESSGELVATAVVNGTDEVWRSPNAGESWERIFQGDLGMTYNGWIETSAGALLFSVGRNIVRYEGGGMTPAIVDSRPYGGFAQPFAQTESGELYFAEYDPSRSNSSARIFKSTDDGQTWAELVNLYDTPTGTEHLHGIAAQGTNRLFVATGDAQHSVLETDDEFSTFNEWNWNTFEATDDLSITGIRVIGTDLILGWDDEPNGITKLHIGDQKGDIETDPETGGGNVPVEMFHVTSPSRISSDTQSRLRPGRNRSFYHRIEGDGTMLYAVGVRDNDLAVSTTRGDTWKSIPLPVGRANDPAPFGDSLFISGTVNGGTRLFRIPKTALFEHPEPRSQAYHVLTEENIGDSSGGGAGRAGNGIPTWMFDEIRIGVETDDALDVFVYESARFPTAPMDSADQNTLTNFSVNGAVERQTVDVRGNNGLAFNFVNGAAGQVSTSFFVQCYRL